MADTTWAAARPTPRSICGRPRSGLLPRFRCIGGGSGVDISDLERQFAAEGIKAIVRPGDNDYALWMRPNGESSASAVSQQMFGRLFYEFQSLAWFVAAHGRGALEIDEALAREDHEYKPGIPPREGWTGEVTESWQRISDELDAMRDVAPGDEHKAPEKK